MEPVETSKVLPDSSTIATPIKLNTASDETRQVISNQISQSGSPRDTLSIVSPLSPTTGSRSSVQTSAVPLEPIEIFAPTPKPTKVYQQPSQALANPVSEPSALTPLRAHYLKRELVTRQIAAELEVLNSPDALSVLGPPFLPKSRFINGVPVSPSFSKSKDSSNYSYQSTELPFLKFFFHKFVLTFPFLTHAPPSFFSHKLQPFFYSFFSRNITGSEDREEETKRSRIAGKVEKHLGLVMAAAIKLSDNDGEEQVVRVTSDFSSTPDESDAFLPTPEPSSAPVGGAVATGSSHSPSGHPPLNSESFDVNVVAIRQMRSKGRVRSKMHEEFVIRTRSPAWGEVYVGRRYGEFVHLAETLRAEFPDGDIRGPPPKDRRAVDGAANGTAAPSSTNSPDSPPLDPTLIHFARERNRLTLRAYLHRLLAKLEIANSEPMKNFLLSDPIDLTPPEKIDVENREARDRARETERTRFKMEVQTRVKELDGYLRGFREELVKSDGLSRVFGTIRTVDSVQKLPIEYRKVLEWAKISMASTIYQVFLGSDNSSSSFAQLKRTHALMPYWAMRGVLKVSNPVAMIRGILDLFLARPFGATSLIQRMFSSGLYEEIRELKEDSEKVASKIADSVLCEKVKIYIDAPREIQEIYEADARAENLDIMSVILRSAEGPKLDNTTFQRIHKAARAYEAYKAYRDRLEDPSMNEGPANDDAWLFEDLHVYMRLMRRCRDKEQLVELIFEGTTSELLKDIVTIFYAPLMQVYKAANISDSLGDLQKFIDDLIRTVERAEQVGAREPHKVVQTFVDLVARHEGAFYNFVHQVHSKGSGLFDGLMRWIELFINFVRSGLPKPVALEALLPHPETKERLELMSEIDSLIDYHRKLKIAHHERMAQRLARSGREENDDHDRDAAFVSGVMSNLNISKVVEEDVEEAANQDVGDLSEEDDGTVSSGMTPRANNRNESFKKNSCKDSTAIEPPQLRIVPTLTPLFTELAKPLLCQ